MQAFDLNLVGFVIPMGISMATVVLLAWFRRFRMSRRSLILYTVVFSATTAFMVILFWYSPNPQSLSMPGSWAELLAGVSGVLYIVSFVERRLIIIGIAEAYAIGTFAAAATDAIRTLILPLPITVNVVHWGGYGMFDLDFQTGIALAAVFAVVAASDALWRRRFIERLIGPRAAATFWAELRRKKS